MADTPHSVLTLELWAGLKGSLVSLLLVILAVLEDFYGGIKAEMEPMVPLVGRRQ
jgi:hypothetical protein